MEIYYENVDDLFLYGEIFKDIEEYNGDYQVSNFGRVKSFKKCRGKDIIILSQDKNNKGYLCVNLSKNGKEKNKQIHDLMFESFNNYKLKKGEVIHHLNENKSDNDLDNFQKMTISEHMSFHNSGENNPMYEIHRFGENHPFYGKYHSNKSKQLMIENHSDVSGENNPASVLTEQDVIQIRELDLPQKEIAEMFGVNQSTISAIKNRRSWKNI